MNPKRTREIRGLALRVAAHGRNGLSLLEFVGCLIAVVGGAWLGAIYLGVDMRHMAYTALEEADLLEQVPEGWRPVAPDEVRGMTREQMVDALRQELSALRHEITALRTSGGAIASDAGSGELHHGTSTDPTALRKPTRERTLAYWVRLGEIALGEAALQRDAESANTEANAAKVFAIKGRVSRFAAKTVDAIPSDQVDISVNELGEQLSAWYERGGELYEKAVKIRGFAADNSNYARLNNEWRQAEVQHRNEGQVLSDRTIAVRDEIRRRFGVEFPMFGEPAAAPKPGSNTAQAAG